MIKRTCIISIPRIIIFIFIIIISADVNKHINLSAQTEPEITTIPEKKPQEIPAKSSPDEKIKTPEAPAEITPSSTDLIIPETINNENTVLPDEEHYYIKAEEISSYPQIILNAYQEAYPGLITEVNWKEIDWMVKFASGNVYFWANGKLLPEQVLKDSDKYIKYSISPYNMNGRFPELYTDEKITALRKIGTSIEKSENIPYEEGGLYNELYGITTEKSAADQLIKVKLSGFRIAVHPIIAEKIKLIDAKINQLAKKNPEVRSYLKNIKSVQTYNWRKIAGTRSMSNHSYGIAVDILPKKYDKKVIFWGWEKDKNKDWMLLPNSSLWSPPDAVIKIFFEENFIWGGYWDQYDTMHFEYRPELVSLFRKVTFGQ